ncbi:chaperone protein dnaJ 20, chloroplastic-like [Henckelia pumila]|uniref:chaperone protein dnaJ 20, chloroplastic-like n=1 Tax=Henckelia pumila TaxID=405737 RepID=UPI003C6E4F51
MNISVVSSRQLAVTQPISSFYHYSKSPISIRFSSGPGRARPKIGIRAFYTPVQTSSETLYELLGVTEKGTVSEIKKAYKTMARKYHPDVSPADRVDEHTRRFIMVQQAYETLSNPNTRASYDQDLAKGFKFGGFSTAKSYQHDQGMEEAGEWKKRWQSQLDELKRRNINKGSTGNNMSWGARMRNR